MRQDEPLVEERLNRLLRRLDWRFLLPNPWPGKTAAAVEGLLSLAVPLLGGEVVDLQSNLPGNCDLVVLQNPDRDRLRSAWEALKPGGALYAEWKMLIPGGLAAVRRRLERAGFSEVAAYWAWPLPERSPSIFWLPLEAPGALSYFLSRRPRSPGLPGNLARTALRVAWDSLRRIKLISPFSVIALKPGSGGSNTSLLPLIKEYSQGYYPEDRPAQFDFLLLTGGLRSINKTALLVFHKGERLPGLVVKMPRVPESIPFLEREASNLRGVHDRFGGHLPGIPRVHFFLACPPFAALGEQALEGEPLQTRVSRENFSSLARLATDWLVKLANVDIEKDDSDWWERLCAPALSEFEEKFSPVLSPVELGKAAAALSSLGELPQVIEQRDFSPWNVLVDPRGQLVVLDWESAELNGIPCLDLIYFLTFLSFFIDGAMDSRRFLDSYRRQLDPHSFTGRVVHECQLRYINSLGLSQAVLPPLRLFAWTLHSLSEFRRIGEDTGGKPDLEDLQRSLFLQLWREELSRIPETASLKMAAGN